MYVLMVVCKMFIHGYVHTQDFASDIFSWKYKKTLASQHIWNCITNAWNKAQETKEMDCQSSFW